MAESRLQTRYNEAQRRYEYLDEKGIQQDPNEYPIYPTDQEIEELADKLVSKMSGE
jgi:hypothetical protein